MARKLILAGAGRFAEEVGDIAAAAGFDVVGWIEGLDEDRDDPAHDPPIVWVGRQASFEPAALLAPAIGSVARRALIDRLLAEGRTLATVVHPSAVVARSAAIEPGCVVFPNVVVGAATTIGSGTIVNRGALIGHHTVIGRGCFVGPGANVAGGVVIGDTAYVGLGAVIRDDTTIGPGAVVGAGAVAVADVAAGSTVVGLPARPIGER